MRIAYVSPVGIMGGAEQCLLNVMTSVRAAAPSAELHLVCSTDGPLLERAAALGVRAHLLPMPGGMAELGESILHRGRSLAAMSQLAARALAILPQTQRYVTRLRRQLRAIDPKLVHSNGLKTHLLMAMAGLNTARTVWHLHDFIGARPAMARALRWASARAAGLIAISAAVARDAHDALPGLPIETVYNGIDVGHFTPDPAGAPSDGRRLDELAGLPPAEPGTVRVGLVATFARWKGQDLLLQAASRFYREPSAVPVRFYVIGGPIYHTRGSQFSQADLRARARGLGVEGRVGFIGFQRDTRSIYRMLDVVAHASTQPEPFGLTIVEAMACGRAVVVSRAGGAAELFTPEVDAIAITPGDAEGLAGQVRRLVADPGLRRRLGEAAYRTATARFSHERLGPEVLASYRKFMRLPRRDRPGGAGGVF